jgi:hypothetical protein
MLNVARRLRPRDIFNLSFTNKLNYQMIGSVSGIWKLARLMYMPCRVLLPPAGMSDKEYAWLLTTDRCVKCHLVKPLEFDWNHRAKCCADCLYLIHNDSYAREQESKGEAKLYKNLFVGRVKALGGERGCGEGLWDKAILAKIPRYANIIKLAGRDISYTDEEFELLKSYLSEGIQFAW